MVWLNLTNTPKVSESKHQAGFWTHTHTHTHTHYTHTHYTHTHTLYTHNTQFSVHTYTSPCSDDEAQYGHHEPSLHPQQSPPIDRTCIIFFITIIIISKHLLFHHWRHQISSTVVVCTPRGRNDNNTVKNM